MTHTFKPTFFDPLQFEGATRTEHGQVAVPVPGKAAYVYGESIILAVNVAIATQRPLLLAGSPGTGKTALAANVAHVLGWKFYQHTITSRTRARDLMWSFDALRRLADAQASSHAGARSLRPREAYIEPQSLWWAFDAETARWRGAAPNAKGVAPAIDPWQGGAAAKAVVLLDEIDKAEPDLPNDLLEALDSERFTVDELDPPRAVEATRDRALIFITTNGERELPAAFIRRCIVLKLDAPTVDWLVSIAEFRFGSGDGALHRNIAERIKVLREDAARKHMREPSTAEYLDAVSACKRLGIDVASPDWRLLEQSVLWKRQDAPPKMGDPQ